MDAKPQIDNTNLNWLIASSEVRERARETSDTILNRVEATLKRVFTTASKDDDNHLAMV